MNWPVLKDSTTAISFVLAIVLSLVAIDFAVSNSNDWTIYSIASVIVLVFATSRSHKITHN